MTHDEMLLGEYAAMAKRIEGSIYGVPANHRFAAKEVDKIIGCADNSSMTAGQLAVVAAARRHDIQSVLARIVRSRIK